MIFISVIAGMLAGIAAYGGLLVRTMDALHREQVTSASQLLYYLVTDATGALAAGFAVGVLVLALLARLVRGTAAVGYARPAQCTGLPAWLATSWHFYGKGGTHSGMRVLGLEIAVQGTLGNA